MLEESDKQLLLHHHPKPGHRLVARLRGSRGLDGLLFVVFILLLTVLFSPVALTPPEVPAVGAIANHTFRANRGLLVEDPATSRQRREQAEQAVLTVYDYDPGMVQAMIGRFREVVLWLDRTRGSEPMETRLLDKEVVRELKLAFAQRLDREEDFSDRAFEALLSLEDYQPVLDSVQQWLAENADYRVVSGPEVVKDLQRSTYMVRSMADGSEQRVSGAAEVSDLEGMRSRMFKSAPEKLAELPWPLRRMVVELFRDEVRPNLMVSLVETRQRRQKASEAVENVFLKVRQGEVVVREGELVTETARLKIAALNEGHWGGMVVLRLAGLGAILVMLFFQGWRFLLETANVSSRDRKTVYILGTILLTASVSCLAAFTIGQGLAESFEWPVRVAQYLPPVALGSSLASLILGARLALPGGALLLGVVLAALTSLLTDGGLPLVLYHLVGVLVGGYMLRSCRRRSDVLRAGLRIGWFQMATVPMVEALTGVPVGGIWVQAMTVALISGLLTGLLGLAMVPVLEAMFNVATDSRLLELASGDHPLLKQLSLRAPGTYHHSVMMGNLAEVAAEAIGANPLMARIMALYHDIGKVVMPRYFVENQSGHNPHDQLSPSMSTKVIQSHIKYGVDLAREYDLGGPILDAITEHQGTTRLQFFYNKALTEAARRGDSVDESEYRYPGPKPRSRETGIIMLADSVEAAARTLKNPSAAHIQTLVRRIVRDKIQDGQLDDCKLTLREIAKIEEAFARVLTLGFYHRRIEYPEQVKKRREQGRHGGQDSGHALPVPVAKSA